MRFVLHDRNAAREEGSPRYGHPGGDLPDGNSLVFNIAGLSGSALGATAWAVTTEDALAPAIHIFDGFGRPDGVVGNGWELPYGDAAGGLVLKNGTLTEPDSPGVSEGIFRPVDLSGTVTLAFDLTQENGFNGLLDRYSSEFFFGSNGTLFSGYGFAVNRGDQNYQDSRVDFYDHRTEIGTLASSFQYGTAIHVTATLSQDGSIDGEISGDGNTFDFHFGPRNVTFDGTGVQLELQSADDRSSTLTEPTLDNVTITGTPASLSGGAILNDAIGHLFHNSHEDWGAFNSTGFVYTVSYETYGLSFFDPDDTQTALTGPYGWNTDGRLLNYKDTSNHDNPDFFAPISLTPDDRFGTPVSWNIGSNTYYSNPDAVDDGWSLVGDSGQNISVVDVSDQNSVPQVGDIFQGLVLSVTAAHPAGQLELHSGIVSAFDPATNSLWLISNWEARVNPNGTPLKAPVTYDQFFLTGSGADDRDVVDGLYAIYRLDGASGANHIFGGRGVDYLGGGGGDDAISAAGGDDVVWGYAGHDKLSGGGGDDILNGGAGADRLTGGAGADEFVYGTAADSTSTGYDLVIDFDAAADKFSLWLDPGAVDTAIFTGRLRVSHFDQDLAAAVDGAHLQAHDAVLFTASTGSLAGHTFLVVDVNAVAGYQAGEDLVIRLDNATNLAQFDLTNFG